MEEGSSSETGKWDLSLPPRLFATDRFPCKRLNIYSKLDTLLVVRDLLRGTPEWEKIRASCFGRLFELPYARCPVSCKLLHSLLTRQLVTKKKYEVWPVFGGHPFRFSLVEFGTMTGLPCGEFPEGYNPKTVVLKEDVSDALWKKIIGLPKTATMTDVIEMMREQPNMSGVRRLRLALLLIVDCVLVASGQVHKPSPKYVQMIEDVDAFLSFPWGRESFYWTISKLRPGKKVGGKGADDDPVVAYRQLLQQETFRLVGFPQVLQLVALEAIPGLLRRMRGYKKLTALSEFPGNSLPRKSLSQIDVEAAEDELDLKVSAFLYGHTGEDEWDKETRDKKVLYMEKKILDGHVFVKGEWPGGDASLPLRDPKGASKKQANGNGSGLKRKLEEVTDSGGSSGGKRPKGCCCEEKMDMLVGYFEELLKEMKKQKCRPKKVRRSCGIGRFSSMSQKSKRKQRRGGVDTSAGGGVGVDTSAGGGLGGSSCDVGGEFEDRDISLKDDFFMENWESTGVREGDTEFAAGVVEEEQAPVEEGGDGRDDVGGSEKCAETYKYVGPLALATVPVPLEAPGLFDSLTPGFPLEQDRVWRINAEGVVDGVDVGRTRCLFGEFVSEGMDAVVDVAREVMVDHDRREGLSCLQSTRDAEQKEEREEMINLDAATAVPKVSLGPVSVEEKTVAVAVEDLKHPSREGTALDVVGGVDRCDHLEGGGSVGGADDDGRVDVRVTSDEHETKDKCPEAMEDGCPRVDDPVGETVVEMSCNHVQTNAAGGDDPEGSIPVDVADKASEDIHNLSDSSPVRPVEQHVPSEEEKELGRVLSAKKASSVVLPEEEDTDFMLFSQTLMRNSKVVHTTRSGFVFDNDFLLTLAEKQAWVSTLHMEVLMAFLAEKHSELLGTQRLAFASPWLIGHIQGKYRAFSKAFNKDLVGFDEKMKQFVAVPGTKWVDEVDTIYAPMNWDNSHWVGLAINLEMWNIEILDSNHYKNDGLVAQYMKPVSEMLPYIVHKLCPPKSTQSHGLNPFTWHRTVGLYSNTRTGDCGPLAAKFMELHALGEGGGCMETMTDEMVDHARQQYAMDIYKNWVLPLYP